MTPKAFRQRLERLLGPYKLAERAAVALHTDRSSIFRWMNGDRAVPGPVIAALELADQCEPDARPRAWQYYDLDADPAAHERT